MNNYFNTGDAVVYYPDGRVEIVLDSSYLREITPKSIIKNGALVLPEPKKFDSLDEILQVTSFYSFRREDLEKYCGRQLTIEEAKSNPVWRILARQDQQLLDDYVDYIFAEVKEKFDFNKAMEIFLPNQPEFPSMRAWYIGYLDNSFNADGGDELDCEFGRLVGKALAA